MTECDEYDLLCIGSGPAGQHAAIQAAKLGKRAAVVERRRTVGGVCVDTGTIPSKTFREAVFSFASASSHFERHPSLPLRSRPTEEQLLRRVPSREIRPRASPILLRESHKPITVKLCLLKPCSLLQKLPPYPVCQ